MKLKGAFGKVAAQILGPSTKKAETTPSSKKTTSLLRVGVTYDTDKLESIFDKESGFDVIVLTEKHRSNPPELDLIGFSGGQDIDPALYGAKKHPKTGGISQDRDKREVFFWNYYKKLPKFGVCRGAQFLCAMNHGALYQDIEDEYESSFTHPVYPFADGAAGSVEVTSVHHQACLLRPEWDLIYYAWAKRVETDTVKKEGHIAIPEAFYIPEDNALCVQFHPEYGEPASYHLFMKLLEKYILDYMPAWTDFPKATFKLGV